MRVISTIASHIVRASYVIVHKYLGKSKDIIHISIGTARSSLCDGDLGDITDTTSVFEEIARISREAACLGELTEYIHMIALCTIERIREDDIASHIDIVSSTVDIW
jgi:hypothetical protein